MSKLRADQKCARTSNHPTCPSKKTFIFTYVSECERRKRHRPLLGTGVSRAPRAEAVYPQLGLELVRVQTRLCPLQEGLVFLAQERFPSKAELHAKAFGTDWKHEALGSSVRMFRNHAAVRPSPASAASKHLRS